MPTKPTHTQKLDSTAIAKAEWFKDGEELALTFTSGKRYVFVDVPEQAYHDLVNADSAGRHFASSIKSIYQLKTEE